MAKELSRRGLTATSAKQLRATGTTDPELIKMLGKKKEDVVLVTYDNHMAVEHADPLREAGIALAVIDSAGKPEDMTLDEYWRDVIHRQAHRFANQEPGSLWRYRRNGRRRITLS
jgi:LmbE family N-acetylglucosaminyl deacetylase